MDNIPKFIQMKRSKIDNPYFECKNKISINVENYDFELQTENYLKLKSILERFNIQFLHVYGGHLYNYPKLEKQFFMVTTTNPNIFWYKYKSTRHWIIINCQKFHLCNFFKMTDDEIKQLLND